MKQNNITNVNFKGPIDYSKIYDYFQTYHIGFAFYPNSNLNNYYCAPNKIYQYINADMAVITNDYPGLMKVIGLNKIGYCISDFTSEELFKAVTTVVEKKLWENITYEIKKKYSWEAVEEKFFGIFKEI